MMLWIVLAILTGLATLSVLVPLARAGRGTVGGDDVEVYRDQLGEIERDLDRGLVAREEAAAARAEIARRLLKADEAKASGPTRASFAKIVTIAVIAFVPAASLGAYTYVGAPDLPDQPVASRSCGPETPLTDLVICIERHLAQNPDDVEGWRVVAPVYLRIGRPQDAARAYGEIVRRGGTDSATLADLGEAIVIAADGRFPPAAIEAFNAAVAADGDNMKARFYAARGLAAEGRFDEAVQAFDAMLANAPPDAPWLAAVRASRAEAVEAGAPAMEAPAEGGAPAVNDGMIRQMVASLAERLAAEPLDPQGWARLVRSYRVLGDEPAATAAAARGRAALAGDVEAIALIDDAANGPLPNALN
ncbi:c-type cytochrome biogenesis protein CcmI [Methylobrevis albus]|uniref:C-type cytochrome biogenesis protein CcmI n=1 Tax=Methylobrevis albus TaxID=2793297 RepID=A0A931MXT2_9HYPH|nr:c-type cytochrome biogenesis protein CcmI [Methylobrevis albus]MBH0237592.1 c-type cytochrome biogenesis protein CcmI [Methylobrevis albus]